MLGFAALRAVLLMDVSSVLNGCAVFANKHALALAHASGGGKCKRRVPYPECKGGRRRRSAQAQCGRLGCLLRAPEAEPLSVLSTCVTKQTKDMRYSEAEPGWFLGFGRTHDDAVCPGKRVGSWINACSSFRVTKRRRCLYRIFAVSLGFHGQRAIVGSTATKKLVRRGFWTGAVSHTGALTQLQRPPRTRS